MYVYIHTYNIHIYIHTYIYTYIYTYIQKDESVLKISDKLLRPD